jgi:outer membrane protein TolC
VKHIKILITLVTIIISYNLNAQKVVSNLDSLLSYSASKSATIKSGYLKLEQSKKAKLAAIYSIFDLTGNASFNITNNTKLPVSLFPAEAFGGQPGTYAEVQTGIKYNSTANIYGDLKLLNIAGWQNLKLSKINIQSVTIDNQLSRKNLYESIAANYYNIVSLNEQLYTAKKSISISDTLYQVVANKYAQGLAKQQDVNTAKVNLLNSKESYNQIEFIIQQQYIALKILCDIPESENIIINQTMDDITMNMATSVKQNKLKLSSVELKEKEAFNYYRQQKYTLLPTVSLFASNSNQQFGTEFKTFDSDAKWINSNYIGIKAVLMLPSASSITNISKAKYDYLLAKENTLHAATEANLEVSKLNVDYQKAFSQYKTNKEVVVLQNDSYYKSLELYKLGLIPLDQLMSSYNAMVTGNYNLNSSIANVHLSQSKIEINNNLK